MLHHALSSFCVTDGFLGDFCFFLNLLCVFVLFVLHFYLSPAVIPTQLTLECDDPIFSLSLSKVRGGFDEVVASLAFGSCQACQTLRKKKKVCCKLFTAGSR